MSPEWGIDNMVQKRGYRAGCPDFRATKRSPEGLKMAPVKPELGKILPKRIKQFRKIFKFS